MASPAKLRRQADRWQRVHARTQAEVERQERALTRRDKLGIRTNWESQVEKVCFLGSSAQRLTDETAEQFDGRCKRAKEEGRNPNRLKPLKATGVTTWERNRNRQRQRTEYGDLNAPVKGLPRRDPAQMREGKVTNPIERDRSNPRLADAVEAEAFQRQKRVNHDGIPAGHIKAKKRA